MVGVVLAWRLGRTVETPSFGVVFATLVATSPLQTTWARLGGIYIGSTAGVLLALWTGWVAGRRGGVVAAVLAGVVAWSCVYFYYSARVGMGLAFVALWAGWRRSRRDPARFVGLAIAAGAALAPLASPPRAARPPPPFP